MELKEKDVATVTFVEASPYLAGLALALAILTIGTQVTLALDPRHPVDLPEIAGATRVAIEQLYVPASTIDDQIDAVIIDVVNRIEFGLDIQDIAGNDYQLNMMRFPIYGPQIIH